MGRGGTRTVEEGTALSLGFDPRIVKSAIMDPHHSDHPALGRFEDSHEGEAPTINQ